MIRQALGQRPQNNTLSNIYALQGQGNINSYKQSIKIGDSSNEAKSQNMSLQNTSDVAAKSNQEILAQFKSKVLQQMQDDFTRQQNGEVPQAMQTQRVSLQTGSDGMGSNTQKQTHQSVELSNSHAPFF